MVVLTLALQSAEGRVGEQEGASAVLVLADGRHREAFLDRVGRTLAAALAIPLQFGDLR
jgi:hypothetical protein